MTGHDPAGLAGSGVVGLDLLRTAGLEHLVADVDDALVDPGAALFGPCQAGHLTNDTCRAWDRVGSGPPCRPYRYALTRAWPGPHRPAVWLMLNPSTADASVLDPTLRRCAGFTRRWGSAGMIVLNAFALRSTDPAALRGHPDPVGPDNDRVIAAVLAAVLAGGGFGPIVLGWGSTDLVTRTGRADHLIGMLRHFGVTPTCLAVTRAGSPQHPLYIRADTRPRPFPER